MTSTGRSQVLVLVGSAVLALGLPAYLLWPTELPASPTPRQPSAMTKVQPLIPVRIDRAVAMPPFSPTRSAADDAPTNASAAVPPPLLVGTIAGSRGVGVALVRGSDGETKVVTPGMAVEGWTLTGVSDGKAILRQGDRVETIAFDLSNRPADSADTPALAAQAAAKAAGTSQTMAARPVAAHSSTPGPDNQ